MKILKSSLLLISLFLMATAFTPPKKGQLYKSDEGKMSIVFPGDFETERLDSENSVTFKTTCTVNDQTYFASYSLHQFEITEQEDMAQVSYDSFLSSVGGKEILKADWTVKKNTGLKAVIDMVEDNTRLEYRVLLVGSIQYQLVVLASTGLYDAQAAAAFFDSFKLSK
jgi:hypothetical protein